MIWLSTLIPRLKKELHKSNHHSHRLACAIVRKRRVVAVSHNMIKTSPRSSARFNMLHAEIGALLKSGETEGCFAVVYRESKLGGSALAKPCGGCEMALRYAGLKGVFYSTEKGWNFESYE